METKDLEYLNDLERRSDEARWALTQAVKATFPVESAVTVTLSLRQKKRTAGVVIGVWGSYARVRLDKQKRNGGHTVKTVHFRNIEKA